MLTARVALVFLLMCQGLPAWAHPFHLYRHHRGHHHLSHLIHVANMAQGLGYGLKHMLESMQPHSAGCPSTAFCGCGVSVRVFGHSVRDLWLAANWFRFPRTSPHSGAVAVRAHHVFYIEEAYGDGTALAYDPNSGGHLTRLHRVSLAGYAIVDPRGSL